MRKHLFLPLLLLLLAACNTAPAPVVPRSAPDDLQATAAWESYRQSAVATQTASAREAAAIAQALMVTDAAATAQSEQLAATMAAQATRESAAATATTMAGQATATHQANLATATAVSAQATATQVVLESRATAAAVETAASIQATATGEALIALRQSAAATATTQAAQSEREALAISRERRLQPLKTYGPWAIGLALLILLAGLGGWAAVTAMRAWDARQRVVGTGPFGRPLVLLDGPGGRRTILDPSRLFGPAVSVEGSNVTMPQLAAPELQNQTTARSQAVELRQAAHSPHPIRIAERRMRNAESKKPQLAAPTLRQTQGRFRNPHSEIRNFPTDAPWSVLGQQWQGNGLPLGMGANGLLVADPEAYPHLLMAGTSGSGKTRFGLRPLIASALAAGWQVAIFDRSGLDFLPFERHPNAHTIVLQDPAQATEHLSLLYEAIQARFVILRRAGTSTWGRLPQSPAPRMLAVMDEFANLADALPTGERRELWRAARMIAAEGRKAGVHLALALQDPTHKSLDLRIRRNCLPLSFRVKDGDASRVILGAGGAEQLAPRQFLTVMDALVRGVAFAPSDEEIRTFLTARPVPAHPRPAWLEATRTTLEGERTAQNRHRTVVEIEPGRTRQNRQNHQEPAVSAEPVPVLSLPLDATRPPTNEEQDYIRRLATQGMSKNAICRRLYGFKNGQTYGWINLALQGH